jgi:PAB-dependent poly(A)-specific ribonuclease subunit 2
LEENPSGSTLPDMLQTLTRTLLDRFVTGFANTKVRATTPPISQVLTTEATSHIRCTRCHNEYTRPGDTNVNELIYPLPKPHGRSQKSQRISFSQVIKASVERETSSKGWCSQCKKYEVLATRKAVQSIPSVFVLNTALRDAFSRDQDPSLNLWCTPGWLPDEIGIIADQGQFFCYEGEDLNLHLQRGIHNIRVYSLVGLAANITDGDTHRPHLVALADGRSYPTSVFLPPNSRIWNSALTCIASSVPLPVAHCESEAPGESQWHLFNDFLVMPVSKPDALAFDVWKVPCVVVFQLKEANNSLDTSWKEDLDASILYEEKSPEYVQMPFPRPLRCADMLVLQPRPGCEQGTATARILDAETERPTENTIVALDTEFVCLRQSEVEVHSDGTQQIIRPRVNALGRVSVVRGWGEHAGDAFIDDYVIVHDRIVDYLTSYSGITQADLDPKQTKHNLVSFKVAYKKLWLLLNLGCRFVGHGLKTDFRVINIHIPKSQVIDTQELFYLPSRFRKLSLSFLAYVVLKESIQQETHDSVEDARTALKLYRKYQEFVDAGVLDGMLREVYNDGQKMGFRPPKVQRSDEARAGTPPLPPPPPAADPATSGDPSTPSRAVGAGVTTSLAGGSAPAPAPVFGSPRWTSGKANGT